MNWWPELTWKSWKRLQVCWRSSFFLVSAAPSVYIPRALFVTTQYLSLRAFACCCSSALCASAILSQFASRRILSSNVKSSLFPGSLTSWRIILVLFIPRHSRVLPAFIARVTAPHTLLSFIPCFCALCSGHSAFCAYYSVDPCIPGALSLSSCSLPLLISVTAESESINMKLLKNLTTKQCHYY